MTSADLERYLHEFIPLSHAMGVRVIRGDGEGVELAAPLGPNLNHHRTAFGGSIASLAILSAWTLFHVRLRGVVASSQLVIQRSEFSYLKPIEGEFSAFCPGPAAEKWERFLAVFGRKGVGRLALTAEVRYAGEVAGRFEGDYVATRG
ncbi:thioesterase domain-containing protein, putative [Verrucomicrobium sp. GAS474]|uniref:YiiD C-terminal domain-containing protein n=1 Tax=Verrucomicrobium sp. GAS474 TaxID=1882831 RepID=UPI00087C3889|nr:YiiD C-terminal domain-containing protein [Verrucomicrobium sp. GAS474]SDT87200.1 thioesterase domain-containing protein, putative [Verrucomicrobium sp. GAS474]